MLIVIEGGDGVGKDSTADAVAKAIGAERLNFPNDNGVTGPLIRSYLRKEWTVERKDAYPTRPGDTVTDVPGGALAFQALQVANRMEVMPRLREAATTKKHLVVCRYWQSGWVYGQLDGLDPKFLMSLHVEMVQPTFNFLLDVPAEIAMKRRESRDGPLLPERYEGKLEFTRKVIDLYRQLWADSDMRHGAGYGVDSRWRIVNAKVRLEYVVTAVLKEIETPLR